MAHTAGCVLDSGPGSTCEGPAGLDSASLSSPLSPVWCRLRTSTWAMTSVADWPQATTRETFQGVEITMHFVWWWCLWLLFSDDWLSLTWHWYYPGCCRLSAAGGHLPAQRWKVLRTNLSPLTWRACGGSWTEIFCPLLPGRSKNESAMVKCLSPRLEVSCWTPCQACLYLGLSVVGMVPVVHGAALQDKVATMPHAVATQQLKHRLWAEPWTGTYMTFSEQARQHDVDATFPLVFWHLINDYSLPIISNINELCKAKLLK